MTQEKANLISAFSLRAWSVKVDAAIPDNAKVDLSVFEIEAVSVETDAKTGTASADVNLVQNDDLIFRWTDPAAAFLAEFEHIGDDEMASDIAKAGFAALAAQGYSIGEIKRKFVDVFAEVLRIGNG